MYNFELLKQFIALSVSLSLLYDLDYLWSVQFKVIPEAIQWVLEMEANPTFLAGSNAK